MRILLSLIILMAFCSCGLEKKVTVTTGGYEAYRQSGMTSIKIKGLHQADVHCTNQSDFLQIHQHNPTFEELKFKKKELNL